MINLHDKYVVLIRNLKQALNHGLILKTVHKVIKFNQKDWLAGLRQNAKNNFQKVMNN